MSFGVTPGGGQGLPAQGFVRATLTGHSDSVRAIACTLIDGRPHAVTGGDDKTVRVWDLMCDRQKSGWASCRKAE
ncbi:hypothetical protein [Streptomyces sp. NBC_00386]|uniref:hypothetical protein n=1 Tax=Streptomyces sp. NBC_00386 TaxID=2975734 RepID=UPI003FCC739C